jgi:hypothetical protein
MIIDEVPEPVRSEQPHRPTLRLFDGPGRASRRHRIARTRPRAPGTNDGEGSGS